jgi:hypothetical protein
MTRFTVNDCVIYHQPETSTHPTPWARDVHPSEHGDFYTYVIEKYWRIARVNADGTLEAVSRSGRTHRLRAGDPLLRKAGLWRRMLNRRLFPRG